MKCLVWLNHHTGRSLLHHIITELTVIVYGTKNI